MSSTEYDTWSDKELIEELRAVDGGEGVSLDDKDCEFVDSIFTKYEGTGRTLSAPQRKWIIDIIERNEGKY